MKVPPARWLFSILFSAIVALSNVAFAAPSRELSPPGLADGPGLWANVWNYPQGDVDAYCASLRRYGIRNLFIQTSRTNTPAIAHPEDLGTLIDAAHRHKLRVIAWAYLELQDPIADADKMLAAAKFRSPGGECVDAIAPDLEKNLQDARVTAFSKRLRDQLGPHYPLIACVYSPLNRYQEVQNIPWKTLAQYYDVIAPMSYWNSKYQKLDAHDYTLATIRTIRELTGRPDIEIHVIGDGMGTKSDSIHQFMKACKKAEATSASLYPNHKPTDEQLATLSRYGEYFEPNARFRLAAFRQMLTSGALPAVSDPAHPISRGHFYNMLTRHARLPLPAPHPAIDMTAPIQADEALSLLAHIVEIQQLGPKKHKRADRWFAPPAAAETSQSQPHSTKPLNFLDASQMVLQASAAIR